MEQSRDEEADGELDEPDLYSVRDPYGDAMNMAQNAERMKTTL